METLSKDWCWKWLVITRNQQGDWSVSSYGNRDGDGRQQAVEFYQKCKRSSQFRKEDGSLEVYFADRYTIA